MHEQSSIGVLGNRPDPVLADLNRHLAEADRQQTEADAIAAKLDEIVRDVAYIGHADNLPANLARELDEAKLAMILERPDMLRAYRMLLVPIAEQEARQAREEGLAEAWQDAVRDRENCWPGH